MISAIWNYKTQAEGASSGTSSLLDVVINQAQTLFRAAKPLFWTGHETLLTQIQTVLTLNTQTNISMLIASTLDLKLDGLPLHDGPSHMSDLATRHEAAARDLSNMIADPSNQGDPVFCVGAAAIRDLHDRAAWVLRQTIATRPPELASVPQSGRLSLTPDQ